MDFETLIQLPESKRGKQWEQDFLNAFPLRSVQVVQEEPVLGPDSWPYLSVRTDQGQEPVSRVLSWLREQGVGLVVNAHKMAPDYVFTYGMVWYFLESRRFVESTGSPRTSGALDWSGKAMLFGAPTPQFLPTDVRALVREFLQQQGFPAPKILVATEKDNFQNTDLIVSLDSLPGLIESKRSLVAADIQWFLPHHYSLVLAHEAELNGWVPL
jgi:hypothetical protein